MEPTGGTGGGTNVGGDNLARPTPPQGQQCGDAPVEPDQGWYKLTTAQYRNTIGDLLSWALGPDEAKRVIESVVDKLDRYPQDRPFTRGTLPGYIRENQALTQAHVDESFNIALAIAAAIETPARVASLVGPCPQSVLSATCVKQFVVRFASRAFRRPQDVADVSDLIEMHARTDGVDPHAIASIVAVVLASPEFLYRIEHGDQVVPGQPDIYELSAFEVAARLSYHFWDTAPDDELWRLAENGTLLQPSIYQAQIERLLSDARAERSVGGFFFDYLHLEYVDSVDRNLENIQFRAFAGADLPGPALRERIQREAIDMANYATFNDESLNDLLTVDRSFARTDDLARIYGAPIWDGETVPPMVGNRPGILSHAWLNASGLVQTRPALKGAIIRERMMCDEIPPPGPGASNTPIDTTGLTVREALDGIFGQPGTSCVGCHKITTFLGYPFEVYDGLARYRTEETIYGADRNPNGSKPVDATSIPQVIIGDLRPLDGPAELVARMIESTKVSRCFSRNLFQYAFSQFLEGSFGQGAGQAFEPSASTGHCATDVLAAHAEKFSLRETFAVVPRLAQFTRRSFAPGTTP